MQNAISVGLILPDLSRTVAEEHLDELTKLIETAGAAVVTKVLARRNAPDPATYVGKGKAEEIKKLVADNDASLVVFDDDLSPAQVRNLEKIVETKVIDRSALILDIFVGRARSREARTQVELAQLEYMLPRLTRAWTHLERQAGGTGGGARRGVGETQLELDRRIVRTRIARLKEELKHIEKTRDTQRKSRDAAYTVALVGYTNAGKSTLFNQLTRGGAAAMDKLFATLDAKSQRAAFEMPRETVVVDTVGFIRKLPHHLVGYTNAGKSTLFNQLTRGGAAAIDKLFATLDAKSQRAAFDMPRETVIVDTVGFLRKLPHHLVASFRSTMEEAVAADLVLHVIDASHPQHDEQRAIGDQVLADLGIDPGRVVEVYNKSDQIDDHFRLRNGAVLVSALTAEGIETLVEAIREREREGGELLHLDIPHDESRLAAKLHEIAEVYEQRVEENGTHCVAWVPHDSVHLFRKFAVRASARKTA